ncbi:glycosyltransferase family 4 protein [Corynebacterium macginleyi]|uniref:glycosyltransferase family 4 protein n=1 Tax=Corynebacterium macginleyi TaxID=38290 RepID=UPI00190D077C|nr:glycosyltransferase family 4 protein [Corynebacterium macginleyi]MBK4148661.1 glycosyltransferase [Corynebacterium macginleyi]MBK4163706.1 glycosyltransferase [Corynebacterium macginleyi]MBK4177879.1 glycosyltransferase [Corynebacterium macginleyi]
MKILLLCWRDSTHPQGGGSERYLERVGEYLAAQGHEVVFRTSKHMNAARREVRAGVHYSRGGAKFGVYPRAWVAIAAGRMGLGDLRGIDAVIDTQNGIPFFARLISGAPTVLLTHHCHREQWPVAGSVLGRLGWFLESRVAPRVYRDSTYVTVSQASREDLEALGIDGARIIANGLDPIPAHVPSLEREADKHLVTLSRLVPHKQIEHAMDTVARTPGAVLDVIGSGWWESNLRDYAEKLGVTDRVRFRGQVTEDYKHALLARADAHLMPSRKEGWGLAVMEAAQHGVPTVGYAFGLRDSVINGETGILVEEEGDFVASTQELLENAEIRRRLGSNAREFAARFSWEKTGASFAQLLQGLVAGQPSTGR